MSDDDFTSEPDYESGGLTVIEGGKGKRKMPKLRSTDGRYGVNGGGTKRDPTKLTNKQKAFADAMLDGAGSQAEAYSQAYDVNNMGMKAIYQEASKLMVHPAIARRLEEGYAAQKANAVHSGASLRSHIEKTLYEISQGSDKKSDQLRALELLGKMDKVAAFSDRTVDVTETLSAKEVESELADLLKSAKAG